MNRLAPVLIVLVAACTSSSPQPTAPTRASAAPSASPPVRAATTPPPPASAAPPATPAATDASAPAMPWSPTSPGSYPVGKACATTSALAAEKRSLPPGASWKPLAYVAEGLRLRVPEGAFADVTWEYDRLLLRGHDKARELGPGGKDRHFAISVRRVHGSAADVVRGLPGVSLRGSELAFPGRSLESFAAHAQDRVGSGARFGTKIGGHPAWVWVTGVEGYDEDVTLVDLGSKEALVIEAAWHTSIMAGQPECWQRQVIGGVVESLEVAAKPELGKTATSTVGGRLAVVPRTPPSAYDVVLGDRVVWRSSPEEKAETRLSTQPEILSSLGEVGDGELVLLRVNGMGNACNGWGSVFVHVKKDGTANALDVPWCGGPAPRFGLGARRVTMTIPKHPPNRGEGPLPEKSWTWENGKVTP